MDILKTLSYGGRSLGGSGVNVLPDKLEWWENADPGCQYAGGACSEQSIEEFKKTGPSVSDVPDEIAAEVRKILAELEPNGAYSRFRISRILISAERMGCHDHRRTSSRVRRD